MTVPQHQIPFFFFCLKIIKPIARVIKKEKGIKHILFGNEEVKLSLFKDYMIVYVKNSKESTKKLLNLISKCNKTSEYRSLYKIICIPIH